MGQRDKTVLVICDTGRYELFAKLRQAKEKTASEPWSRSVKSIQNGLFLADSDRMKNSKKGDIKIKYYFIDKEPYIRYNQLISLFMCGGRLC